MRYLRFCFLFCLLLAACAEREPPPTAPAEAAVLPSPSPTLTLPATAIPPTITPSPTHTTIPSSSATPPPTATATPSPTATPDPYAGLTIPELAAATYGGGQLEIIDAIEETETVARYLFTYPSDGLTIYGHLTVPHEGREFPVVLMLHGYIPPREYETVTYTERYATALAEAGYFVIHPNFRNYPPSDSGPDPYRIGFARDVLNLIAVIRQQSQDPTGYLRRADADQIHLWGHSMGGGVALRVLTVNRADYLKSAVLYGSMSGDERQNYAKILEWSNGRRGHFELDAPPETLDAISPINYLAEINAAVSIHHSDADAVVPLAWSEELCRRLEELEKPVECFTYHGAPHTFNGPNDRLFIERTIQFLDAYSQ
jgi:dipeptidyl aminopeptidase/acylaminoacyl peptidase